MIERKTDDGWVILYDHDGETEIFRYKPPEGVTQAELEAFAEHLIELARKEAREKKYGPS